MKETQQQKSGETKKSEPIPCTDGSVIWVLNGDMDGPLHREDGPAVDTNWGRTEWWLEGKQHREDGPAIEYEGAPYMNEWWLNDEEASPEDLVDLWLMRGVFCFYDKDAYKLVFEDD